MKNTSKYKVQLLRRMSNTQYSVHTGYMKRENSDNFG